MGNLFESGLDSVLETSRVYPSCGRVGKLEPLRLDNYIIQDLVTFFTFPYWKTNSMEILFLFLKIQWMTNNIVQGWQVGTKLKPSCEATQSQQSQLILSGLENAVNMCKNLVDEERGCATQGLQYLTQFRESNRLASADPTKCQDMLRLQSKLMENEFEWLQTRSESDLQFCNRVENLFQDVKKKYSTSISIASSANKIQNKVSEFLKYFKASVEESVQASRRIAPKYFAMLHDTFQSQIDCISSDDPGVSRGNNDALVKQSLSNINAKIAKLRITEQKLDVIYDFQMGEKIWSAMNSRIERLRAANSCPIAYVHPVFTSDVHRINSIALEGKIPMDSMQLKMLCAIERQVIKSKHQLDIIYAEADTTAHFVSHLRRDGTNLSQNESIKMLSDLNAVTKKCRENAIQEETSHLKCNRARLHAIAKSKQLSICSNLSKEEPKCINSELPSAWTGSFPCFQCQKPISNSNYAGKRAFCKTLQDTETWIGSTENSEKLAWHEVNLICGDSTDVSSLTKSRNEKLKYVIDEVVSQTNKTIAEKITSKYAEVVRHAQDSLRFKDDQYSRFIDQGAQKLVKAVCNQTIAIEKYDFSQIPMKSCDGQPISLPPSKQQNLNLNVILLEAMALEANNALHRKICQIDRESDPSEVKQSLIEGLKTLLRDALDKASQDLLIKLQDDVKGTTKEDKVVLSEAYKRVVTALNDATDSSIMFSSGHFLFGNSNFHDRVCSEAYTGWSNARTKLSDVQKLSCDSLSFLPTCKSQLNELAKNARAFAHSALTRETNIQDCNFNYVHQLLDGNCYLSSGTKPLQWLPDTACP
jgi:hypothetical protein